jgi:O-antigen ligase
MSRHKLSRALQYVAVVAWVVSAVLGTRYVFGDTQVFGELQYLEYITPYLALSTLCQAFLVIVFASRAARFVSTRTLSLVLLLAVCAIAPSQDPLLSTWWFLVLLIWVWSLATLAHVFSEDAPLLRTFIISFIFVGVVESTLGILQFTLQHNLGLSLLGEPIANASTLGVAKVVSHGQKLLRPFGTFPHSNVYGGYLAATFLALVSQKDRLLRNKPFLFQLSAGLVLLAIILTYSRSTWIAVALIFLYYLIKHGLKLMAPLAILVVVGVALFAPAISSRFVFSEQSEQFDIRARGLSFAVGQIKSHPLGLGTREFIPHYLNKSPGLNTFFYQPPHNVLALMVVEVSIIGTTILLVILLRYILKSGWAAALPLFVLVILGISDHYLLTLIQGLGITAVLILWTKALRGTAT